MIDAERATYEIQALANETANRIGTAVSMLKDYRRGFPTGGDAPGEVGSSRTEALALAGPDDIDRDANELGRSLERALAAMRTAYNITARYNLASRPTKPSAARDDDGWCVVHTKHNMAEPVHRGHACRWCYDFTLMWHVDPPSTLIDARARGERITEPMVMRALGRKAS